MDQQDPEEMVQPERMNMWSEAQQIARQLAGGHEPSIEAVIAVLQTNLINDLVGAVQDAGSELKALREMTTGSNLVAESIDRITDRMAKAQGARRGAGPSSVMNNPRL